MQKKIVTLALIAIVTLLIGCGKDDGKTSTAPKLVKLTDNVYYMEGDLNLPNKKNRGFMNNPGIVITKRGVAIIDPGSNYEVANKVIAEARKLTDKPIIAVFNSHIHGDHWLGNGAIKKAYPKAIIYAHPEMQSLVKAGDGERWIKIMNELTGGAMGDTKPVGPDIVVNDGEVLKLGETEFRMHIYGDKTHTDNDLIVEVVQEKVVFLGDVVMLGRLPANLETFHVHNSIKFIDKVFTTGATHYVPGHGSAGGQKVMEAYRIFLQIIYDDVKKYSEEGNVAYEMKPKVVKRLSAYKGWVDFEKEVGRIIARAYAQIEEEMFK
ncbi:MAG: MBL fold metallo-hydrolase [Gammaproteobacteria bacterium]|nr:MAG: MBL fold metallo-hydrolase [Gammaproteobacteria bacterium]